MLQKNIFFYYPASGLGISYGRGQKKIISPGISYGDVWKKKSVQGFPTVMFGKK